MSLRRTLDAMALTVGRAGSVPLSASCLVNRAEMLSMIERARAELPAELDEATALLVAHQEVLDAAEREGEQVLEDARSRAAAMVEDTVIVASAQARADAILKAARTEATRLLRSADEYCDRRLGLFQADLEKCLEQVQNGRGRLQERSELDTFAQQSGLADAADAVDDAAYQASRDAAGDQRSDQRSDQRGQRDDQPSDQRGQRDDRRPVQRSDQHYDQEADGYDLTEVSEVTEAGVSDLPEQARPGDRVIDLRGEAEPAGLGPGRTLQ